MAPAFYRKREAKEAAAVRGGIAEWYCDPVPLRFQDVAGGGSHLHVLLWRS